MLSEPLAAEGSSGGLNSACEPPRLKAHTCPRSAFISALALGLQRDPHVRLLGMPSPPNLGRGGNRSWQVTIDHLPRLDLRLPHLTHEVLANSTNSVGFRGPEARITSPDKQTPLRNKAVQGQWPFARSFTRGDGIS